LKKVLLIYGASVIVFYVFMIGFPNDSLGGQLFMSLPDTTLKGVPMVLAVVYILSTFFVLGLGFYKLAKRIHEPQKQKKLMYLFWGFVVFGLGSAMEILIPTYVIFIARILEIVSSYLLYKGFSA
jgi:hypothetical protein